MNEYNENELNENQNAPKASRKLYKFEDFATEEDRKLLEQAVNWDILFEDLFE